MKKNLFKKITKAGAMAVLSLSLVIPSNITAVNVFAEDSVLIEKYDFELGLREFHDKDSEFELTNSGGLYVQKLGPQVQQGSDIVDANGFVITGQGANMKYHTQPVANQPGTKLDSERGTVLLLCDTYDVPELVKELPADVEGDAAGSETLDAAVPVGTVVRDAKIYKSSMTFTNPFKKLNSDGAVLAFWGKVPADTTEDKLAFIEFDSEGTAISFAYDASVARGQWNFYTYIIEKDSVKTYINGVSADVAPVVDGTATEDYIETLKNAKVWFGATNASSVNTAEETVMDNVAFYDGTMTDDEVTNLYNAECEAANRKADISNPIAVYELNSEDQFTDISEEYTSSVEMFNINGHEVPGVAVAENPKVTTRAGIKLTENPFAGMRLEGATVGYWIQVEPRAKKVESGIIDNAPALVFMDEPKYVYNPKESDKSKEAFSYLYTKTGMYVQFMEGGYSDINIGNSYTATCEEDVSKQYVNESKEWHYITLTFDNDKVLMYRDGVKVNTSLVNRGARFFDGYYRRINERAEIYTLYGMFGGSGNQKATMMMSYLAYSDTYMHFGFLPTTDYLSEVSSPINVTRVSCYDINMTDDDVKALYEQEVAVINEMPEYVEPSTEEPYIAGDINGDGNLSAPDALIILKIAAKMMDATDKDITVGDITGDGKLDATDALKVLRIAAKIE